MRLTHVLRAISANPSERNTAMVSEPKTVVVEPRAVVVEPRAVVVEPRAVVVEPRAVVVEPRAVVVEPRAVVVEPRAVVVEPRAVVVEPRAVVVVETETLRTETVDMPIAETPSATPDAAIVTQTMTEAVADPVDIIPAPHPDTYVVALVEEEPVQVETVRVETVEVTSAKTPPMILDGDHKTVSPGLPEQKEKYESRDVTDVLWQRMWDGLNNYQQNICHEKKIPDPAIINAVAKMIEVSLKADNTLIRMLFAKKRSDDLTSHQLDMSIVATRMGIVLGYNDDCLRELTLGAMLHDIGMLKVSPDVVMKKGELSQDDLAEIRKHPLYSYEILKDSGLPALITEIVRQVHERADGSGYPQGLRGDDIHEYASIISLADTFTAMLQPRPQRPRKIPFEIVKEIIERGQGQLSRRLMKVLIDEFAIFPVGLYVQLNTGEIAKVHKANKLAPLRPEVTVLTDTRGRRLTEPKQYNLMHEPLLTVVDSSFDQEGKSIDMPVPELEESAA